MSKWKCDICNSEFNNYHAEGFNNKIYCPLCYYKHEYNDLKQQLSQLQQEKEDLIKKPKVIVQNKLKEITEEYHKLDKKNLNTANIIAHQYNSMRTVLEEVLSKLKGE